MNPTHRRARFAQNALPLRRDEQLLDTLVMFRRDARDEALFFDAAKHIANGRAVDGNQIHQSALIDTWTILYRYERRELNRRQTEVLHLVEENGRGDLLRTPHKVARGDIDIFEMNDFARARLNRLCRHVRSLPRLCQ